mgnify:CR=1 FL=1
MGDPKFDTVLVFARTKHGADKIARRLESSGIKTGTIHSNRSQNQRLRALKDFKSGAVRVLVATDIAARGIDVDGISHVVNYDFPMHSEDYVHRIGRTGRAHAIGDAISFHYAGRSGAVAFARAFHRPRDRHGKRRKVSITIRLRRHATSGAGERESRSERSSRGYQEILRVEAATPRTARSGGVSGMLHRTTVRRADLIEGIAERQEDRATWLFAEATACQGMEGKVTRVGAISI